MLEINIRLQKAQIYQRHPLKNQYSCLIFIAMLYTTLGLCCPILLGNKLVQSSFGIISATSIIGPFWFILGDVIAEVYGFQMAIRLFILECFIKVTFIILCDFFVSLESFNYTQSHFYYDFFQYELGLNIISSLVVIVAWYFNTYLLIKWKILMKGRYYWLRSMGSTAVGLIIFSLLMLPTWYLFDTVSTFVGACELAFWGCILKIIFTGFFAIPISFVVKILKIIEHSELHGKDFTPFKQSQHEITL